jgi:hypothetical protein
MGAALYWLSDGEWAKVARLVSSNAAPQRLRCAIVIPGRREAADPE